jgi:hypothetical protein
MKQCSKAVYAGALQEDVKTFVENSGMYAFCKLPFEISSKIPNLQKFDVWMCCNILTQLIREFQFASLLRSFSLSIEVVAMSLTKCKFSPFGEPNTIQNPGRKRPYSVKRRKRGPGFVFLLLWCLRKGCCSNYGTEIYIYL